MSAPSPSRPRTKTKTFTGCWTCRRRKVKCDEARPSCQQCIGKAILCAGYTTRLQWLSPETSACYSSAAQLPTTYPRTGMSLRRHMFHPENPQPALSETELDGFLAGVEAEVAPPVGAPTVIHGPFALFSKEVVGPQLEDETPAAYEYGLHLGFDLRLAAIFGADDLCPTLPDTDMNPGSVLSMPNSYSVYGGDAISLLESYESPRFPSPVMSEDASSGSTPLVRQPSPFRLSAEAEHLLHHYIDHVVDLMTVVATPRGPWKSVHLPRALQGTAELAFAGRTSHACNALFHTLLTVSAYNLAANHDLTGQALQARRWRDMALRLKALACTHLRAGLAAPHDRPDAERGKYKEFLAAMLSMITIGVCSGETRTAEWHLRGLGGFIRAAAQQQTQRVGVRRHGYSRKAQALHRVYVYLRVMRESTDLRVTNPGLGRDGMSQDGTAPVEDDLAWLDKPLFFADSFGLPDDWLLERSSSPSSIDLSACEFVYGIPFELLVLMGKTSELIRRTRTFTRLFPGAAVPARLRGQADDLEAAILEWPIDRVVADLKPTLPSTSASTAHQLIEHQTRAFHQAVVVYFSHLVRAVHRRHLQPYVRNIIRHLEAVEVIKYGANTTTGCILWPGFIGAAEAVDPAVQSRYLQWFQSTRYYGLGAYDQACAVVLEVWARQRAQE